VSTSGGTKAVVAALLANTGIAVSKFIAFLATGSSSMLAESIHSVADAGNQGLLLLGGRRAQRQATPTHPFGYGRERYIYAFIVAVVLFTVGGLFALYEGWHKIQEARDHHAGLDSPQWAVGVLVVAIDHGVLLVPHGDRGVQPRPRPPELGRLRPPGRKSPELPVVLLEDLAALLGLIFALVGVSLAWGDRQRPLRRHRHPVHRRPARRGGDHPRHRDEEPVARGVGDRRGCRPDLRRTAGRRRGRAGHPHADPAPRS
jgi:cation diffusion facilitator family transporter